MSLVNTNGHSYEVRSSDTGPRLIVDLGEGSLGAFDSGARMVIFPEGHGHIETTEYYIGTTDKRQRRSATIKLSANDIAALRYGFAHLTTCLPMPTREAITTVGPPIREDSDAQQGGA